jgi:hypothetical protein
MWDPKRDFVKKRRAGYTRADRTRLLLSFRMAAEELERDFITARAKRLQVARRAHEIYVRASGESPAPSLHTFERLLYGKSALPDVRRILDPLLKRRTLEKLRREAAKSPPLRRARLDRERLRGVFREAIRKLERRLVQGRARPLQIARRAYALYTNDAPEGSLRPSPYTFQRLIYGKAADPGISELIRAALKGKA